MAQTKKGKQTPTQAVVLPYRKTLGSEAIEVYEKSGRTAQEWQKKLINQILARNKEDLWVHTKYGYSVPRRNGKNEVVVMREMRALVSGERTLHTAHRTSTSHAAWERLCDLLSKAKIEYKSLKQFGFESIEVESTGGVVNFRTRSSKGGLGEGYDLLIIDEAQEYTDDQESALKYVVSDSKNPQTLFCGTPPTAVSAGTVFMNFRKKALEGGLKNAGWAEWSIPAECKDLYDKKMWYATNPSLGTILTERAIEDEVSGDAIDFNIQRLGLWIKYNQKSAISQKEWETLKVDKVPPITGKLFVGIKYGHDGAHVALSIAVKMMDERIFVESIDCRSTRNGPSWILEFLLNADIAAVVVDGANGQELLKKEMKNIKLKSPILPTVKEIIVANSSFEQAVYQKTICHAGQPSLAQIVTNCDKRPIGSNGGFGYKALQEDMEIALMDSAILAHWACSNTKEKKKQKARY